MNFAALQKFAPLLDLLGKMSGRTTDEELGKVAAALAGDGDPKPLASFLTTLRGISPETKVSDLLGSPAAMQLLESVKTSAEKQQSGIFCTCPVCQTSFETEL